MKYTYPDISTVFDTEIGKINTIIIEKPSLFRSIIEDIQKQIDGLDGMSVISDNERILPHPKYAELLLGFCPFDLNKRSLINKVNQELEKQVINDDYERAMTLLGQMEALLLDASMNLTGDIQFTKLDYSAIIKSVGIEFQNDYNMLSEKILDYIELVSEYERPKLFFIVNLRSYIDDIEMESFMQTALLHNYHIMMIENCEYDLITYENRIIIDKDLCEIS